MVSQMFYDLGIISSIDKSDGNCNSFDKSGSYETKLGINSKSTNPISVNVGFGYCIFGYKYFFFKVSNMLNTDSISSRIVVFSIFTFENHLKKIQTLIFIIFSSMSPWLPNQFCFNTHSFKKKIKPS